MSSSGYEASLSQSDPSSPGEFDEGRFNRLQDTAGFSPNEAHVAVTGIDAARRTTPRIPRQRRPESEYPHPSRRGGRSFPEGTENELDPHFNPPSVRRTDEELAEQMRINERGRRLTDDVLAPFESARDEADAEERGIPLAALRRARRLRARRRSQGL